MREHNQNSLRRFLAWWMDIIGQAALAVVVSALLAAGIVLHYTVNHLGIDTDTGDMFSEELPFRRVSEDYSQAFPQYTDNLLVVIDGETPDLAEDASRDLAARLAQETDLFRTVYKPGGGPFFEGHGLLYLSLQELQELVDNLAQVQPFLGQLTQGQNLQGLFAMLTMAIEAVQAGEELDLTPLLERIDKAIVAHLQQQHYPLSWQELILGRDATPEERRRFIILQPYLDFTQWLAAEPAIQAVRRLTDELRLEPAHGVRVRISGELALNHEELQTVTRGAEMAGILALIMVGMVLFIGLGAWQLVLATLVTLVVGLILTGGFAAAAVGHLNLISIAFAVLYIGLGVDYALHLSLRYKELIRQGDLHRDALRGAARDVGGSLVLCALTTAIGFYAFIPTAFAGVSELGVISGTGMFISLLANLTLLPALLSIMPTIPIKPSPKQASRRMARPLRLPSEHPRLILASTLVLTLGAVILLPQARFDFNPIHLRDPRSESVATFQDLQQQSTTSPWSIVVLAEDAQAAREQAKRLEQLEVVAETLILEDFIPANQDEKLAIIQDLALILGPQLIVPAATPAPGISEQITALQDFVATVGDFTRTYADGLPLVSARGLNANLQRFLEVLTAQSQDEQRQMLARLQDSLLGSLPGRLETLRASLQAGPVTLETLPKELVARWIADDGRHRIEVFPQETLDTNIQLRRFVTEVQALAPQATEEAVIIYESGQVVVRAFIQAFSYALGAIALLLLVLLSPRRDALLVLTSLLLMAVLTGAALVLLDIPFNFANIIALPLLLGIGVDSGIHIVHRFRTTAAWHGHLLATSTAKAVLFSALTTVCSFGNLAISPHPGTASMGQLLTLGIGFTLLCTMIVLPALLQRQVDGSSGINIK